jgi:hypothetical protein
MFTSRPDRRARWTLGYQPREKVMFSKSRLLAIALGLAAMASATAPASALSSQVYAGHQGSQPAGPPRELPSAHRNDRTTVGHSMYPMPRRPMRQPFL